MLETMLNIFLVKYKVQQSAVIFVGIPWPTYHVVQETDFPEAGSLFSEPLGNHCSPHDRIHDETAPYFHSVTTLERLGISAADNVCAIAAPSIP